MTTLVMQFDTDLVTLRQQSSPFYRRGQFWWTTVPILLTLALAATALAMRITSPSSVRCFTVHTAVLRTKVFSYILRNVLLFCCT